MEERDEEKDAENYLGRQDNEIIESLVTVNDWIAHGRRHGFGSLKVKHLKDILRSRGELLTGNKAALVERVQALFPNQ